MFQRRKLDILDRVREEISNEHSWNSYSIGNGPPIRMKTFVHNRKRLVDKLRGISRMGVVFLEGEKGTREELRTTAEPFRQEEFFFWTFGVMEPNFCGLLDVLHEKSYLFYPKQFAEDYPKQTSGCPIEEYIKKKFDVDFAVCKAEMIPTIKELSRNTVFFLRGKSSSHRTITTPAEITEIEKLGTADYRVLYPILCALRSVKTGDELTAIEYVTKVTSEALMFLVDSTFPGMCEHKLLTMFSDYALSKSGCRIAAQHAICTSTSNVRNLLHCKHSQSCDSVIKSDELCVFDVTCHYMGFHSSLSITFPISGVFNPEQSKLYGVVLKMREALLERLGTSVTLDQLETLATEVLLSHLKSDYDILNHPLEDCLKAGVGTLFMPLPVCHPIGLEVDEGWVTTPAAADNRSSGDGPPLEPPSEPLEEGAVLAIGPHCFFLEELMDEALADPEMGEYVRESALRLCHLGGAAIKDVVVISGNSYRLLSSLPREVADVEAYMRTVRRTQHPYLKYLRQGRHSARRPYSLYE